MSEVGIHRKGEVNLQDLLRRLRETSGKEVGAIGCFIGVVRGESRKGEEVKFLSCESAEEAGEKLGKIADDVESRPSIKQVMIHHVVDRLSPGEDVVYVLVSGKNRSDVFRALSDIMDKVKTEVPIWKKEITTSGEYWAHETR